MNKRFCSLLNLKQFAEVNEPISLGEHYVNPPKNEQRILRMLVRSPYSNGLKLPNELNWLLPLIHNAEQFQQREIKISHPFLYVTVRHGVVNYSTDDEWHVDGFSMRYNHLPEANYIYNLGSFSTQCAIKSFNFPDEFDPLVHNIHSFFDKRIENSCIKTLQSGILYFIDPYVVHRRDPKSFGFFKTFVRISFTPIEIPDIMNTLNPLIETKHYVIDGVKNFRNKLKDYDEKSCLP